MLMANYGYAFILKALLQLHQRRHLFDAGRAPCSPEIQHYNFAAKVAEGDLAVGILDGEIRARPCQCEADGSRYSSRPAEL